YAHFSWVQTAPDTITFTNLSHSNISNWVSGFDFGGAGYTCGSDTVYGYYAPGHYQVCVILELVDSTRCDFCDTVIVTGPVQCHLILTSSDSHNASCSTCADVSASVYYTGGTTPYTYIWSTVPVQTTSAATGLTPGNYTVCI